ncbi:alpha-tocopherol transfer protein-like isoform X2 [Planococcus citri]
MTNDKSSKLSEYAVKLAKQELREDEQTRQFALIQMREWIKKNPRIIHCRTDDSFLLRFLRVKKFSLPIAQETLERYLLLRHVYGDLMFHNLDIKDTVMNELLHLGYLFAAPKRDKHGRRIIIARPGVFDPYKYTNAHMCHFHAITYETLMEDEENQVVGYVHFADGDGFSFPHLTLFTPREAVRIVKNGERVIPMRHKEVHGINVPAGLKYVLDFGISLVSEKIRKRIKIHNNLQELHDHVDKSLLPKEYGGDMPMAEMIRLWKEELYNRRETLLTNDAMAVKLEMYNEAAKEGRVSALKSGCGIGAQNDCADYVTGSFRQLAVD